ncbi:acetylxylan esterase [Fictibacillus sp. 23RED33]|uniref:acetylxylan esterase n=1 Tax=Fictibacillus sp. 23RED33 TaxID=2745879 RepID=UPI0018CF5C77|nr:acetylxylan esterase [Fictibacillus sp. 23RED33]MBH0173744.1 acetylxylan esterase [Fictibacillus sp. 23RED33]
MNAYDEAMEQLQNYKPKRTKKADFEEFWNGLKVENQEYPLNVEVKERAYSVPGVKVYDVAFDGFRNSRIHGVYVTPELVEDDAPAAVIFHGYNWNTLQPHYTFKHVIQGIPVLLVDVRGQSVKSADKNSYENGGAAGWLTQGIFDRNQYYYTHVYMDCYRSVDVVRKLSGKRNVYLEGGSQGGGLAIATAALQENITLTLCDIPFLTDFEQSVGLAAEGPYTEISHYFKVHDPQHQTSPKIFETLSYVDAMNLASSVTCPVLLSVGMMDPVCPPLSAFALYHHLGGPKVIRIYREYGHEVPMLHEEEKLKFIHSYIKRM